MGDILCLGGTGTVGSEVVNGLRARGAAVRCMTRSPDRAGTAEDGVRYVWGDLEKPDSLAPVFAGASRVHVLTPLHPHETELGTAAVEAARAAGVERIVLHSVQGAETAPDIPHLGSKLRILEAIRASGIPWVAIEPNHYFQNDLWLRRPLLEAGVYPTPLGSVGVSRVDVRDIADATVAALLDDGHEGRRYVIAGPRPLTGADVAACWSAALGRPITYVGDDLDAWGDAARSMLPDWMVDDLRRMFALFLDHGLVADERKLAASTALLGHAPRRLEDFAAETAALWAAI